MKPGTKRERRYAVAFFKMVADDYGRDREICQRATEVLAVEEGEALRRAMADLCRLEGLSHWSQHADRYEVEEVERAEAKAE